LSALGQITYEVSGVVRTENKTPLPGATIILQNTTQGTISGPDGRYKLFLPAGKHTLQAKYIGYKTQIQNIEVKEEKGALKVDFILPEETLQLEQVVVTADKRDPAYTIIEKAIAKKKYFKSLIKASSCKAYTKTSIILHKLPDYLTKDTSAKDSSRILYFSENLSRVAFQAPNSIKEEIYASRVSGNKNAYSLFSSLFLRFNLYDEFIEIEGLTPRGFISPLADNALFYYRYKLLGSAVDNGKTLYKIEVTPRRPNDPVFKGILWIVDESYAVRGFDLNVSKERQLQSLDSLYIRQTYMPVGPELWLPMSVRFEFLGNILGIVFGGYSASVLSEYDLAPNFSPSYFNKEVLRVLPEATRQDSGFWQKSRPIALDSLEFADMQKKDSLEKLRENPKYLDSLSRKRNQITPLKLFTGYSYYNYRSKNSFRIGPILDALGFNTMEGWLVQLDFAASFQLPNQKRLVVAPTLRYGFANNKFSYKLAGRYNLGGRSRGPYQAINGYIELKGGDFIQPFGAIEQIEPSLNTYYSLFDERNYLKLYQKKFVTLESQSEIINGLNAKITLNYEYRTSLPNATSQVWFPKPDREYTPNIDIPPHQVWVTELNFLYQPANRYITTPDGKFNLGSNWPLFSLLYRKGWNPGRGNIAYSSFDFIELGARYKLSLKMLGKTQLSLNAGRFWNNDEMQFPDYYHFKGNQTVLRPPDLLEQFSLLNYYSNSTAREFLQGHIEHNFGGFLFNKIPGVRKLKLQEIIGAHYAHSAEHGDYAEISAGLDNLFRILRFDFHYRLLDASFTQFGFTLGLRMLGQ
jgi:hypothetical protein